MSHYVYLGAYVKCYNPVTEKPRIMVGCPSPACSGFHQFARGPFCSACGTRNEEFVAGTILESAVSRYDIELANESLAPAYLYGDPKDPKSSYDIWFANIPGPSTFYSCASASDDDEIAWVEMPDPAATRAEHLANLETHYASGIESLRQHYGAENVSLEWGFVAYWL
jgi:hypothetical protein